MELHERRRVCSLRAIVLLYLCVEWRTSFLKNASRNPISLLQLSSQSSAVLFRLNVLERIPSGVIHLLQDSSILKVGVASDVDAKFLQQDFPDSQLSARAVLDLQKCAKRLRLHPTGLRVCCAEVRFIWFFIALLD